MGLWYDQARKAAARTAGRRYWKWLLAIHILRTTAPVIAVVAALAAVGVLAWLSLTEQATWLRHAIRLTSLMRWASLAAVLIWLGWLTRDIATGNAIRRHLTGQRRALPAVLLLSGAVLFAGSFLLH